MNRYSMGGGMVPPAIKNLLLANLTLFILEYTQIGGFIIYNLGLSLDGVLHGKIWQLFTYMFLHDTGNIWHIGMNMFILWMFGKDLEWEWGSKEFLKFYFISGIGGGLIQVIVAPNSLTIGASGAIYGIFAAYLALWPDRIVLLNFLFPVKIKYLIGFYIFLNLFGFVGSNVAIAAHLGGFTVGFLYLKFWFLYYKVKSFVRTNVAGSLKKNNTSMKYNKGATDNKTEFYRKKIDELLDKINKVGYLNLTEEEKKLLDEGSRYLREHDKENFN